VIVNDRLKIKVLAMEHLRPSRSDFVHFQFCGEIESNRRFEIRDVIMKKIISLIIVCCLLLVACASNDEKSDYITPAEQAEIWGEQTIEAFMNKDKDALKGLFNEKCRKSMI